MGAQENKLTDELLPEIEMSVTLSKLSETVRVDLFRFSEGFTDYLVTTNIIEFTDGSAVDTIEMPLTKFTNFSISIRDAYCKYRASQNAYV